MVIWFNQTRFKEEMLHTYTSSSSSCHAANTDFPDSLAIGLYPPLLPASPLDYILCPYKAVLAGRLKLAHPCEGVHWRTSLISSSLLLPQCPASLFRLIWMVLEMGGRWPYSCCFAGCCFQNLFIMTRSIFVQFFRLVFSLNAWSASMWCIHIVELTQPLLGKNAFYFFG